MERAKTIIIFFAVVSILFFVITSGLTWIRHSHFPDMSSVVEVIKFKLPVPK